MKRPDLFRLGNEFIESMKELITHYEGAIEAKTTKRKYAEMKNLPCYLCEPKGIKETQEYIRYNRKNVFSHTDACGKLGCPWIVITGMNCDDWARKNKKTEACYLTTEVIKQRQRIKQLKRWIKIYEQHILLSERTK